MYEYHLTCNQLNKLTQISIKCILYHDVNVIIVTKSRFFVPTDIVHPRRNIHLVVEKNIVIFQTMCTGWNEKEDEEEDDRRHGWLG